MSQLSVTSFSHPFTGRVRAWYWGHLIPVSVEVYMYKFFISNRQRKIQSNCWKAKVMKFRSWITLPLLSTLYEFHTEVSCDSEAVTLNQWSSFTFQLDITEIERGRGLLSNQAVLCNMCNSNTTKWIKFSWTPSTVNRTQGPHWFLLQLLRINNPFYYWILQRVRETFKSSTLQNIRNGIFNSS